MIQAIFCAQANGAQVDEAVCALNKDHVHLAAVTIISRPQELEWMACPETTIHLSLKRGLIAGAAVGALIGLAMIAYMGSAHNPWGEASLVMWESFGWTLFGMIVGSSGLLAKPPLPQSLIHHFEEAIGDGKILISVQVERPEDLNRAATALYEIGAADMHPTEALVA